MNTPDNSPLLVTKRRVIAAFEAHLQGTLESTLSVENTLRDGSASEDESSSDRLGNKQEEMMDDVVLHDSIASDAKDRLLALHGLNTDTALDTVEVGALVITNQVNLLICAAIEPMTVDGVRYSGISAEAPVGQALLGKKVGDSVEVNGRSFKIEAIA